MNIALLEMGLKDLVTQPYDPSEFIFRLIELYNAPPASIKKLKSGGANKADLIGDVLWQRKFYFRTAELGKTSLTLDVLKQRKPAKTYKPRFIITTDGKELSALDTKLNDTLHCDYEKLNDHFDFFLPLAGIEKYAGIDEAEADVKAAGRLARLHDEIMRANPGWRTPERRHALNQFMTRVLFCLFSEDTGSFPKDLFVKTITEQGGDEGQHLKSLFQQIFDIMNVHQDDRGDVPKYIDAFPYVNGGLFADRTEVPEFTKRAKRLLMEAAELEWKEINPDIFGSMIQAVADEDMRGDLGMHYTSVPNIMKVLQPLFLMNLEEEFAEAQGNRYERDRLNKLLERISKIRVFDPACGSGNFLIIAYQELRKLEMRIFQRLDELEGGQITHRWDTGIKLSNFYGIEIADFAAETAKLSLWIAEYQMNQRFKMLFGETRNPFPLVEGGHIFHDNALHCDWHVVCPPPEDEIAETYIVGNPPYKGSSKQSESEKRDIKLVFEHILKTYKNLDYVAGWYLKAADYCQKHNAQCALVATNSICQGEQVALLWPLILERDVEISFAHQSFKWKNLATNNAGVTCVIVGLRKKTNEKKILFQGDTARHVKNIGPYLIEMNDTIVHKSSKPLNSLPLMSDGSKATDGGFLLLADAEKAVLIERNPEAAKFIRQFSGTQEFTEGIKKWCIWVGDSQKEEASSIPALNDRFEKVRGFRLRSSKKATNNLAAFSYAFGEIRHFEGDTIIAPAVSSERRPYLPVGFLTDQIIVSNSAFQVPNPEPCLVSILSSKMHYVWAKTVCGQHETRLRYSNVLGYNTFPIPQLSKDQKIQLEEHAWAIIGARDAHPGKTIAWLYDPKTMPQNLHDAHRALDDTLEKIYIGRPFKDDTERLEHLFKMYEKMMAKKSGK